MLRLSFFACLIQIICCIQINTVQTPHANFGVSPYWDARSQNHFYADFVSAEQPSIYRFDFKTGQTFRATVIGEPTLSFIVPIEGSTDQYAIGVDDGVKIINWVGLSSTATVLRTLYTTGARMNFGFADPSGRLFSGTLSDVIFCSAPSNYSMYRYSSHGGAQVIFNQVKTNTGFAIDKKRGIFYHIDACTSRIVAFDYDLRTGDLCNGRIVFDFRTTENPPPVLLGLDIDCDGNLYVGFYLGSAIAVIDPSTSTLLRKIPLQSTGISGVAFGGPQMDKLFVLAANTLIQPYEGRIFDNRPDDPSLYIIEGLNAKGCEYSRARI